MYRAHRRFIGPRSIYYYPDEKVNRHDCALTIWPFHSNHTVSVVALQHFGHTVSVLITTPSTKTQLP